VIRPQAPSARRENELEVGGSSASKSPLRQVCRERCEQANRPRLSRFGLLQITQGNGTLDDQCPVLDVSPLERESLARPESRIGQNRNERRISKATPGEERLPKRLDRLRRDRAHHSLSPQGRLLDRRDWIGLNTSPDDRSLENALEERRRLGVALPVEVAGAVALALPPANPTRQLCHSEAFACGRSLSLRSVSLFDKTTKAVRRRQRRRSQALHIPHPSHAIALDPGLHVVWPDSKAGAQPRGLQFAAIDRAVDGLTTEPAPARNVFR